MGVPGCHRQLLVFEPPMGKPHTRYAQGVSFCSSGGGIGGTVEGPAQAEVVEDSAQSERLHALQKVSSCSVSGAVSWGLPRGHGNAQGCGFVPNIAS